MKYDYDFFLRRYGQIEDDFLEIMDFVDLPTDFDSPIYSVGSSKLMDFCLKVGTEVETLFREILDSNRFDTVENIDKKRKNQKISVYREIIEPEYRLREGKLLVKYINKEIMPFEKFNVESYPAWFSIYSKYKHSKVELLKKWGLKHGLFSLGGLLMLLINHPDLEKKTFRVHQVPQKVFDLLSSRPKYHGGITNVKF